MGEFELDQYLNGDDYQELRRQARGSFWIFASKVIGNEAYDAAFHRLLCAIYEHEQPGCPSYPPGDYYYPTRSELVEAAEVDFFTDRWRISYPCAHDTWKPPADKEVLNLTSRLRRDPTSLDGSFIGVFVRITMKADLKVFLVPRAHLKSTLLTRDSTMWDFARNQSDIIGLIMNSGDNVKLQVSGMKSQITHNERLQRTFPTMIPDYLMNVGSRDRAVKKRDNPLRWQQKMFDVPINEEERLGIFRERVEASLVGIGITARLVSQHYRRIKYDDICDDKNTKTPEGIQKTILDFQAIESLGIGDITVKTLVGTPWSYGDVHMWLLDPKLSGYDNLTTVIATVHGTDGEPFYPKKFTVKNHPGFTRRRIQQLKSRSKTAHLFSSQYLMQPVDSSRQSFKPGWWKFFDPTMTPWRKRPYTTVITLDPAISEKRQGDYSAFIVAHITDQGFWYVVEIQHHRGLGTHGLLDVIFELNDQHQPHAFGIEGIAFQKTIRDAVYDRAVTKRLAIPPIVDVYSSHTTDTSKEFRIKRIAPRVEQGMVMLPVGDAALPWDMKWQRSVLPEAFQVLVSQGERFPRVTNDDILDAMSMVLDVNLVPVSDADVVGESFAERNLRETRESSGAETWQVGYDDDMGTDW